MKKIIFCILALGFYLAVYANEIGQIGGHNYGYHFPYGEIYAQEAYETITITAAGEVNKVQITTFDTNGVYHLTTPDHTTDDITIFKPGVYRITCMINADSVVGAGGTFGFSVFKNNGTVQVNSLHGHLDFAGGSGEVKSVTMTGIATLALNDTIEIWVWNYTGTENIVVDDITLGINKLDGD